jgi:hypothetical protein
VQRIQGTRTKDNKAEYRGYRIQGQNTGQNTETEYRNNKSYEALKKATNRDSLGVRVRTVETRPKLTLILMRQA